MDISLLGSFVAEQYGVDIVPNAAKPRLLLALLATYWGRVVPIDVIIMELWDGSPPRTVTATLHTYVMSLRRLIAEAYRAGHETVDPKRILRRQPVGYQMDLCGGRLDIAEFDRLAGEANRLVDAGDCAGSRVALARALALWRGAAFADVRTGPRLSAEVTRLEESRRMLIERRIRMDLRLGRQREVLGELAGLTREQPLNESLAGYYVLALYRCGQRTRALTECDRVRRRLATEFGMDLSPALAGLRQAILLDDPALATDLPARSLDSLGIVA